MWITILIIVVVIGAIAGFFLSDDGERGAGALSGALMSGMGCASVLFHLFLVGLTIFAAVWLFGFLFG